MARISFDELLEMTATGCPKPAMRSVEFARTYQVPLHVRSAFTWEPGTLVGDAATHRSAPGHRRTGPRPSRTSQEEKAVEQASVIAVTHDTSDAKVTVAGVVDQPGIAASLFRQLATEGVNVDLIVQNVSESGRTDISFTVPQESFDVALATSRSVLGELGARGVTGDDAVGKVSLVGSGMRSDPGVAARMFETLAAAGVNIEMISTSPIRTSCVVRREQVELAVRSLHTAFGLDVAS